MQFVLAGLLVFFVLVFVGALLIAANVYLTHTRQTSTGAPKAPISNELHYPRISEHV